MTALLQSSIRSGVHGVWPPTLDDSAYYGNDFDIDGWAATVAALVSDGDDVRNAWASIRHPNNNAGEPPPMLVRACLDWLRADAPSLAPLRRAGAGASSVRPRSAGVAEYQDRPRITRVREAWVATDRDAWWAQDMDVCFHRSGAMRGWCARIVVEMGRNMQGDGLAFRTFRAEPLGVVDEQALLLSA